MYHKDYILYCQPFLYFFSQTSNHHIILSLQRREEIVDIAIQDQSSRLCMIESSRLHIKQPLRVNPLDLTSMRRTDIVRSHIQHR